MAIKKIASGYEVRFRVNSRGSREHGKVFPTKAECERFQRYTIASFETQVDVKPCLEKYCLSELMELWESLISKVCIAPSAHWRRAEGLTVQRVRNNQVTFTDTKNGKNRSVPIKPELFEEIHEHAKLTRGNNIFTGSISSFRRALKRTSIELPKGQAAHVLRHTFASHFIMNGGNILTLQKVLGHSDIKMTMRYAHLAPDFQEEATRLNPLSSIK